MSKAVVYPLLAAAFIIFLTASFSFKKTPISTHTNNKSPINRRLGHKFRVPFDPMVSQIHRLPKEEGIPSNLVVINESTDTEKNIVIAAEIKEGDTNEFSRQEGEFNITYRLTYLFPLLDKAPDDGFVSLKELQTWMIHQTEERLGIRTADEMKLRDTNGDGAISFGEYLPQFSDKKVDNKEGNATGHGEVGWWKQQFSNADVDKNGSLDSEEFNNFLHPVDSKNKEIQKWVAGEKLVGMDINADARLDYTEFVERVYHMYKAFVEFESADAYVPSAQLMFAELDKNKDRYLVAEEMTPILSYLQPGELQYARYYSSFLINTADDNNDGKLSLEEMLNHEDAFYTVFEDDEADEEDEDFEFLHDEL